MKLTCIYADCRTGGEQANSPEEATCGFCVARWASEQRPRKAAVRNPFMSGPDQVEREAAAIVCLAIACYANPGAELYWDEMYGLAKAASITYEGDHDPEWMGEVAMCIVEALRPTRK